MIKATDRKLVVGLEIGTAKVAALVGEVPVSYTHLTLPTNSLV